MDGGVALDVRELEPVLGEQAFERLLGRRRCVLHRLPGPRGREALLDEAREDVVHALPRKAGEPRRLGGGRGVAAEERQVRARLVARQAKPLEPLEVRCVHEVHPT